jgi:hypothetical protein
MMVALPQGYDPMQMRSEHPNAQYETFHRTIVNEQARPKSMPYNKAACDSSDYNYASGRLDHQTYYGHLDDDRLDADELVLDVTFDLWFDLAILTFGWLGGNPESVGPGARFHTWDWPKHRVADVEAEANANKTRLESGQVFLHQLYTDAGMDFDDEVQKAAVAYGVTEQEMRKRLLDVTLPATPQPAPAQAQAVDAVLSRLNGHINGNGVLHHAN